MQAIQAPARHPPAATRHRREFALRSIKGLRQNAVSGYHQRIQSPYFHIYQWYQVMATNPLASQMKKEEQLFSKELTAKVTKALQAKALQKQLDALTQESSRTPPKKVQALFDKVLADQQKSIAREYSGMKVVIAPSYQMKGPSWIGSAVVTVSYPLEKRGGKSHLVKPGDTLWDLAEQYYGSGYYWVEIEKANPAAVACKGDFILAGVTLKIPALDIVPANSVQPVIIKKTTGPAKTGAKVARPVATPVVEIDLERTKSTQTVMKYPGMTVIYTLHLKGSLKAQKPGTLPASFNLRTYETEIANGAKPFQSSFKIKANRLDAVSIASNVSGSTWTSKVTFSRTGSAVCSLSPKPVKFKNGGIIYEGNVALELEIRAIPDPKTPAPRTVTVLDQIGDWYHENSRVVAGVGLLVVAGGIVAVTIGEDIVTLGAGIADDPVSFAAAGLFAQRGLAMMAR